MKLKKKYLPLILLLPAVILALLILNSANKKTKTANPLGNTKKETPKDDKKDFDFKLEKWEDPAGFAFEYPKELKIDTNQEVEEYYAFLELEHQDKNGNLLIAVIDSEYPTIDEWAVKDEKFKDYPSLDTKIAEFDAKKVNKEGEVINAFIDPDQVIYLIHKKDQQNQDYWNAVYNKILETFELIPLEGETQAEFSNWLKDFDTSSVDVVQPVEVIQ